jgi:tRNA (guanosine-2'-O-)-methyltransferase
MPTPERIEKVKRVLALRQPDLRVIVDGISIAHNASAVVRTCDAAGVLYVHFITPNPDILTVNKAISTKAEKWVDLKFHPTAAECLIPLKKKGLKVAVTHLGRDSSLYTDLDYTQPLALVFGSESEGVTPETLALADYKIRIPMLGMVQSLNLSVSVGIILYEALKQRRAEGFFGKRRLPPAELKRLTELWLKMKKEDGEE